MSRISGRRLLALGALAFLLRGGISYATSVRQIFPDYYYADATALDEWAKETIAARNKGEAGPAVGAPSHRLQIALLTAVYSTFGYSPLAAKFLHAAAGAVSCVLLAAAVAPLFGPACALASGGLLALWPSAVFGSSQIMKDPLVALLAYAALWALLPLLGRARLEGTQARAASGAAALVLAAFFRSYVMLVLSAAIGAAALWSLKRGSPGARAALAAAILAPALYLGLTRALFNRHPAGRADSSMQVNVIPQTYDPSQRRFVVPLSPQGITDFRVVRQTEDQKWSAYHSHREIATQIYPNARFNSWLSLAMFVPKASFHVLFMPFPGLYPIDGKLARAGAAMENLFLLFLMAAALAGIRRLPLDPARTALLAVFLFMSVGSALLEFDLGSSTRHKAFYFPLLFPFAAGALLGPRRAPEAYR